MNTPKVNLIVWVGIKGVCTKGFNEQNAYGQPTGPMTVQCANEEQPK